MTRAVSLFTASFVLAAGIAAAGQAPSPSKPRPLSDRALDAITAGSASEGSSGGAIVANNSQATINESGNLTVGGNAQQDSRALNLVNATSSAVANAVNVFDGRIGDAPAEDAPGLAAATQETSAGALLRNVDLNVDQTNRVTQNISRSASLPVYIRPEANLDETISLSRDIEGSGKVETVSEVLGQSIQGGQGFAGAASADLELVGGSIAVSNKVLVSADGTLDVDLAEGLLSGEIDADLDFETKQKLLWTLPSLKLHVDGVVCAVSMGSCEANGTFSSSSETTRIVRSPIEIEDAVAEFIVVDGSSLDVSIDQSVALSGFAQQGARALNMVSAAGSAIANSVNVARSPSVGPILNLNQVNVLRQGR